MVQDNSRSKVARLIKKYDLTEIGDELENRWTRSEDRYGLRQLTVYFNRRLLTAAIAANDTPPLEGEISNLYRLLTDDDVSSGVRTQARNRLEQNGVDVDALEEDFVSKQAIHTYLTKYRGVESPSEETPPEEQLNSRRESLQRLRQRLISVAEGTLTELRKAGQLTLGEFTVHVNVRVYCTDCGTQMQIDELLTEGACNCESSPG